MSSFALPQKLMPLISYLCQACGAAQHFLRAFPRIKGQRWLAILAESADLSCLWEPLESHAAVRSPVESKELLSSGKRVLIHEKLRAKANEVGTYLTWMARILRIHAD